VLTCLCGAACFTVTLFGLGGKRVIGDTILNLNLGSWELIALIVVIIFILGMFMDWVQIVPVCFPIFLPMITKAGFDPLWFSILMAVTLQSAFLTPPVGAALFYLKGVAPPEISMGDIIRGIWPFTAIVIVNVILCCVFPQIITWLPQVVIK
jgi:TRAP-type mannitol/chloroaromatic compound transport system permease large subunit